MKENYILNIKAEDRPGLLHSITGRIERKKIEILSLSAAPTDIHDIVMITIEISIDESDLAQLALKLENIIEVFAVTVVKQDQTICLRAAWFKMGKAFLETPKIALLQKYNATIINWYPNAFLVAQYGSDVAIRELYNQLEGPHLLGFIQTGLLTDTALIDSDEVRVMSLKSKDEQSSIISVAA